MRRLYFTAVLAVLIPLCGLASRGQSAAPWQTGQPIPPATPASAPPSQSDSLLLRNHHILLTPAGAPGTGEPYWIAVAPDGQLAVLPVTQLQAKMAAGYRPYTFGEFQDALTMLMNSNVALTAQVKGLQSTQSSTATQSQPPAVSQQDRTQIEGQVRDQQRRQAALMFLMGQRPMQPYQLPMPKAPNNGLNCTTTYVGTTAYTTCH